MGWKQDSGLADDRAVPTTVRPPLVPVPFGVLAGRAPHLVPVRRTAMHALHAARGATFLDAGQWKRPSHYRDPQLEATHVREKLGIIDVSTLGKLELSGADVVQFLHFMLPGKYRKLAVGRTRYSTMIGEDGVVFEDGTISQVADGRYYITTTTGNQDAIESSFWWWIEALGIDVRIANLSRVRSAVNVSGARSREFLQELVDIDMSNAGFPYMSHRRARLAGVSVLLFRIGFTGELSYEIHFPSEVGRSMWEHLLAVGAPFELEPFGVETQRILRLEKGHLIPGIDTDALSSPFGAGLGFTVKTDKPDFIGRRFLLEAGEPEERLVAFALTESDAPIPEDGVAAFDGDRLIGRVTSSRRSPTLGHGIGLAWLPSERAGPGAEFEIRTSDGATVRARVLDHAAYDPSGERLKA